MNYLETAELILRGAPRHIFVADKTFQPRVADGRAKGFKLFARALGGQFNATVGLITHVAGNFKSGDDGLRGVAEPDALHVAGIKNPHATAVCDWHWFRHAGDVAIAGGRTQC